LIFSDTQLATDRSTARTKIVALGTVDLPTRFHTTTIGAMADSEDIFERLEKPTEATHVSNNLNGAANASDESPLRVTQAEDVTSSSSGYAKESVSMRWESRIAEVDTNTS
jgi:hypothetical protein